MGILAERGLFDAAEMLEAMMTGHDHPIFDFMQGIRASKRPQSAPPTIRELAGRLTLVGMVRAYCIAANVKPATALRVVVETCSFEDFKFTPDQIRGWEREWAKCDNRDVDAFTNTIMQDAERLPATRDLKDRVIEAGIKYAFATWVTPAP